MINNHDKSTKQKPFTQIAGLHPGDDSIEFSAAVNESTLWMQHGCVHYWNDLPKWRYEICLKEYLADKSAQKDLSKLNVCLDRQVEIFIHHKYGDVDGTPDMVGDKLQPSENYRTSPNCSSLDWDSKWITIDGFPLTKREIIIVDGVKADKTDFEIACDLGITESTLSFHKKNLFTKVNVQSRNGLLTKAITQKV